MNDKLTTQAAPPDLRALLKSDRVKEQIALAIPKHMDPDRMCRVALTATSKNPALLQCDTASVLTALMACTAAGIEPDGRNAHLIPYGKTCQLIIDYRGYVILAKRNGLKNIHGDVVCENDTLVWKRTESGLQFSHEYDFKKPRGAMYAAYVTWNEPDGGFMGEIMQKDDIDAIRKRSRASGSGPWVTDYNEMAKKTVIRRASKKWDISPEVKEAVDADDGQFERDVTPSSPAGPPKLFDDEPPPAKEQTPAPEPTAEPEPPASDDQRNALLDSINEARDADGVSVKQIRAWSVKVGIIGSEATPLPSYPAESLKAILERWGEIKA